MLIYGAIVLDSTMVFLLEDRVRLGRLEFSLEVANSSAVRAAIGATTGIGEVVTIVVGLVAGCAPRATSAYEEG